MNKMYFVLIFLLSLLSISSVGKSELQIDTTKKDTTKKVIIVTKQNLEEKVDSLKQPYKDTTLLYQKKVEDIDKKLEKQIQEYRRLVNSKKKVNNKVKTIIIKDTVFIEIQKESWFKKQFNKFKNAKKSETQSDK